MNSNISNEWTQQEMKFENQFNLFSKQKNSIFQSGQYFDFFFISVYSIQLAYVVELWKANEELEIGVWDCSTFSYN